MVLWFFYDFNWFIWYHPNRIQWVRFSTWENFSCKNIYKLSTYEIFLKRHGDVIPTGNDQNRVQWTRLSIRFKFQQIWFKFWNNGGILKIYVFEQKFIHVIAGVFFFRISQNRRLLISVPWEEKGSKIKTLRFEKICMLSHESILDKTKIKIWNKFVHVFFPQIFDSEICENG